MTTRNGARATFAARAEGYESESSWVANPLLIDPLLSGLDERSRVADICAGTGVVGRRARSLGHFAVELDLSADMLRHSSAPLKVAAEGERLPLADGAVDRVICRQALHYLDLQSALREFGRTARVDVAIGSITSLSIEDEKFWMDYFRVASPARRVVFHPGTLEQSLVLAGLEIVSRLVIRDRGSLLGPIKHLPQSAIDQVVNAFDHEGIRERYEVTGDGDEASYVQRWEFIVASIPSS